MGPLQQVRDGHQDLSGSTQGLSPGFQWKDTGLVTRICLEGHRDVQLSSQGVSVVHQGFRASLSSAAFEVLTQPQEDVNAEQ